MMFLLLVTCSIVLAAVMGIIAWRIGGEERRRSEVRVATLAAEIHGADTLPLRTVSNDFELRPRAVAPSAEMFAVSERAQSGRRWPTVMAAGVFVVATSIALIIVLSSGSTGTTHAANQVPVAAEAPAAAPALELVALGHERDGDRLIVRGVVRNPPSGTAVDRLAAVVFVFNREGGFLTSSRMMIDPSTLRPGGESILSSPFPARADVGRTGEFQDRRSHRVSCRSTRTGPGQPVKMMRATLRATSLVVVLLAALVVVLQGQQQPPPPPPPRPEGDEQGFRFKSGVELINVTATVSDQNGRFVAGLHQEDFLVYEDDQPVNVTHFNSERVPVSLGIAVDTSGSMAGQKIEAARGALDRFLFDLLDRDDEFFLYRFSSVPMLLQDWTRDRQQLTRGLGRLVANGGTAMYDAVADALPLAARGQNRKKALLLISGSDTQSTATVREVKRRSARPRCWSTRSASMARRRCGHSRRRGCRCRSRSRSRAAVGAVAVAGRARVRRGAVAAWVAGGAPATIASTSPRCAR